MYNDAMDTSEFLLAHACLFMVLMCVPPKEFGLFSNVWLRNVPEHQLEHMVDVFSEFDIIVRNFEAQMPSILFWNWLFADSDEVSHNAERDAEQ